MCTSCTWRIHFFTVPAGVTKEPAQMQNEKKNGRGISEVLSKSPGCVPFPVPQGEQAWRHWAGVILLSGLGQSTKPGQLGALLQFEEALRRVFSPVLPCLLSSLSLSFAFSPFFSWWSLHSYLSFLMSLFLFSFLPQLYTCNSYFPPVLLSHPSPSSSGAPSTVSWPCCSSQGGTSEGRRWVRL